MDPLSALSIAASVAQFIEFGCSLVSKTRQIYKSAQGATVSQVEATIATRRLIELSQRLKASVSDKTLPGNGSTANKPLEAICDSCISLSEELLARLEKLRVQEGQKHRKFKSLRQALKSVWSREAIYDIANRLDSHRKELDEHLLLSVCDKLNALEIKHEVDLEYDEKFKSLDEAVQKSINALRKTLGDTHKRLEEGLQSQRTYLENIQRQNLAADEKKYIERQHELDNHADSALLNHLKFSTMTDRRNEIVEAHRTTFSWIFKDPKTVRASPEVANNTRPWSNFVQWLREDEDIYWINGKAGSGKSTLMRFISESPETGKHLHHWSGSARLRVASFFFWNSGSKEQRSQSGLLRSLLFDILCGRRDLLRYVFKDEWEESRSPATQLDRMSVLERLHSFQRLKEAFHDLVSLATDQLSTDQLKLCFFIDGLDEYEGDPEAIIDLFKNIPGSPFLKICLSSRPLLDFEEAFADGPSLRLQDLTYKDIRLYVCDKLEGNPRMLQLSKSYPILSSNFVKEILSKANGVFLWVHLVTRSLLNGLKNRDDMSDLQERLKIFPSDLDKLYSHMLSCIDPFYMKHASRIFQIYNSASDVDVRPTVLELELAVTSTYTQAMTSERKVMSEEEIRLRCDRMSTNLKVQCGGLLEAHDHLDSDWEAKDDGDDELMWKGTHQRRPVFEESHHYKIKADAKVSYLHRTVSDYLRRDSVRASFERHTNASSPEFEPNFSLLMSYLVNLKQSICSFYFDTEPRLDFRVWRTTNNVFHIAQRVDSSKSVAVLALLQEFNVVGRHWWLHESMDFGSPLRGRDFPSKSKEWQHGLLCVAVRFGLCSFVETYLRTNRIPQGLPGRTILLYALGLNMALNYPGTFVLLKQPACPAMVELLLRHGENPNKKILGSHTVWMYCIEAYRVESALESSSEHFRRWSLIFKSMLQYGADIADDVVNFDPQDLPPWEFEGQGNSGSLRQTRSLKALIEELVAKSPPDAADLLRDIYKKRNDPKARKGFPSPAPSSPCSSSSTKRTLKTFKESQQSDGTICIDLLDDDDDDSSDSASRSTPRSSSSTKQSLKTFKEYQRPDGRIYIDLLDDDDDDSSDCASRSTPISQRKRRNMGSCLAKRSETVKVESG